MTATYRAIRQLGRGGMGEVYEGRQRLARGHERRVAIARARTSCRSPSSASWRVAAPNGVLSSTLAARPVTSQPSGANASRPCPLTVAKTVDADPSAGTRSI